MIEILIVDTQDPNDRVVSITSFGHSRPEICNAVSTLIQTTGGFMAAMADMTEQKQKVSIMQDNGTFIADMTVDDDSAMHMMLDTAIHMLCYGLFSIEEASIDDLDVEAIMDMDSVVTRQDRLDCIVEWRKARQIYPEKMKPPGFKEIQ